MPQPLLKPTAQTTDSPLSAPDPAAALVSETELPSLTERPQRLQPRPLAHGGAERPSQPNVGQWWCTPTGDIRVINGLITDDNGLLLVATFSDLHNRRPGMIANCDGWTLMHDPNDEAPGSGGNDK